MLPCGIADQYKHQRVHDYKEMSKFVRVRVRPIIGIIGIGIGISVFFRKSVSVSV